MRAFLDKDFLLDTVTGYRSQLQKHSAVIKVK